MKKTIALDIKLYLTDNGLIIQRLLSNTFFIFVGGLLGSIFGIMGTTGAIMQFVENSCNKFDSKIKLKKKLRKLIKYNKEFKILLRGKKDHEIISRQNSLVKIKF